MSNLSQHSLILKMLRKAGRKGVPNYKFPQHRILNYKARLSELRQDGENIYCERQKLKNGRWSNVWQYYLLEEDN